MFNNQVSPEHFLRNSARKIAKAGGVSMDEWDAAAGYISSYLDMLIYNLRPSLFAIRFRRMALGGRRDLAPEPAWMQEQSNDLGMKCWT